MLASVIADPKTNVPRLVSEPDDPLRHALLFCGISLAITFAAQAPLLADGQDFTATAGALLMVKLFEVLLFNAILVMIFKLIGGTGTFEQTLTASLYISSPVYLFVIFAQIIGVGLLAGGDPQIALSWRYGVLDYASPQWATFATTYPTEAYGLTILAPITFSVVIAWFIYCWSIYRELHNLTRWRSLLAYLLAFVLFLGVGYLRVLVVRGLGAGAALGIN